MKSLLSVFLVIAICFSLCACGEKAAPAPTSASLETAIPATAAPLPTVSVEDSAPSPSVSEPYDLESFLQGLDMRIQPGSAGCSLKAVNEAAWLLDWASVTDMSTEEINIVVSLFLGDIPEDARPMYNSALEMLDSSYKTLMESGQESLLATAGCTDCGYPWGAGVIESVESFMVAAGLRSQQSAGVASDGISGVYGELADLYYAALSADDPYQALAAAGLNPGVMDYVLGRGITSLGCAVVDLNSDGVREFVVGPLAEPYVILDIYTLSGLEAIPLFHGRGGNVCAAGSNGLIANLVTAKDTLYSYHFYTIAGDTLNFMAAVTHDSVYAPAHPWYLSADTDMYVANDQPISTQQAQEYIDQVMAFAIAFEYEAFAQLY